jgi:5-methylcytosine-specific restriction endonuclease McrA
VKTFNCENCDKECVWSYQSHNKFCSVPCAQKFRSNEHKKKFFSGLLDKRIDRPTARKYLAEARGYKCEVCGLSDWQGRHITLQVDHINGDPSNDHPNNLRLICPNCHSQTEFLGGANKGRGRSALGIAKY